MQLNVYMRTLHPLLSKITFNSLLFYQKRENLKNVACSNYILKTLLFAEEREKKHTYTKKKKKNNDNKFHGLDPFKCKYYGICRLWHGSYSILFVKRKLYHRGRLGLVFRSNDTTSDFVRNTLFTFHFFVVVVLVHSVVIIY